MIVLLATFGLEPLDTVGEVFDLKGFRLRKVLSPFREWKLVEPDMLRSFAPIEEQQVCRNRGVGSEHAVGQSHDGVQVKVLEQLFLDASADAVAEECAIGDTISASASR